MRLSVSARYLLLLEEAQPLLSIRRFFPYGERLVVTEGHLTPP